MKRVSGVMRLLSAFVDYVIVSFPVIFIMMMYFKVSGSQADLFQKLLLAVYGTVMVQSFDGATLGKKIGRMKVVSEEGVKPALMNVGIRELTKSLYLIPVIGWIIAIVSSVMLFFGDGRTIHDRVSRTRVIYVWHEPEVEKDEL